jgi:hypothetical protein
MHAPAQFQADVLAPGHVGAHLHSCWVVMRASGVAQVCRADAAAGQQRCLQPSA